MQDKSISAGSEQSEQAVKGWGPNAHLQGTPQTEEPHLLSFPCTQAECFLTRSHSYVALCFLHCSFDSCIYFQFIPQREKIQRCSFFLSFKHLDPASSPTSMIYSMPKSYQFYVLHISQICPSCAIPTATAAALIQILSTGTIHTSSQLLSLSSVLTQFQVHPLVS